MRQAEKVRLAKVHEPDIQTCVQEMIALLTERIENTDVDIQTLTGSVEAIAEDVRLLRTAPGIGPVAATTCVSLLPGLGRLSPKKIASLTGLAPFNRDSGAMRGKRQIGGRQRRVRHALYMAAISAILCCDRYKVVYGRIAKRGGAKKVAIIAVARQLLTHLNAMIRDRKKWV